MSVALPVDVSTVVDIFPIITYAIKYDYGEPLYIITYDKYNYERIIVFCQESGVQVECITYAGKIVYGQSQE